MGDAGVWFGLLGPLEVKVDGAAVALPARPRVLLAALLCRPNRVVSADELGDFLWGERWSAGSATTLRGHVLRTRRMLGGAGDRLQTVAPGYRIDLDPEVELDTTVFTRHRVRAGDALRSGDWQAVASEASAALALWRDLPLADVPSDRLQQDEVPGWIRARNDVAELAARADLALGRPAEAVAALQRMVVEQPHQEGVHALLMEALAATGQRAEALAVYRRLRAVLSGELGLEPGPETTALHQRILVSDPAESPDPPTMTAAESAAPGAAPSQGDPVAVLRQLPAELATFSGRSKEISTLVDLAVGSAPGTPGASDGPATASVVVIEGMGGMGKTRLAVRVAHQLVRSGRFADLQLFVNLRGFDPLQPPADPCAVLGVFLRQLGVPDRAVPGGLDERSAMYRDRMQGRAALVVLDNAADEDQVRELIPASPSCLVLVTSRRNMASTDAAATLVLAGMSEAEGVRLLARIAGPERISAEPESAARVVALCGGLPLALSMVAARLRSRPLMSLTALADRLAEDGVDAVSGGTRSLRQVFDLSYQGLPAPVRRMFSLLGAHPGDDFTVEAAASLAGVEWAQARDMLETLQDEYLLQQDSHDRYSLHDLLRGYAAGLAAEHPDAVAAGHRLLTFYLDSADRADRQLVPVPQPLDRELPEGCRPVDFATREQALAWFDAEYHNLRAALRSAAAQGHHLIATELPVMMGGYFALRVDSDDWIAALRIAVDAATELGDVARLGGALNRLGGALTEGGRHEEAAEALTRAVELGRTLEDGRLRMAAQTNLAVVLMRLGSLDEAASLLNEVLPERRRSGNRVSEGVVLENLGSVSLRMAEYEAAIDYCEQAIAIYEQMDRDHELVNALNIIGEAHRCAGRLADAERTHRRALDQSLELRSRRAEGHSLHQLGLTLRAGGADTDAVECLRRAVDAYTDAGDPRAAEVARLIQGG